MGGVSILVSYFVSVDTILSCEEIFCLKAQCVYIQSCLVKKYFASRPSVFIYNLVLWRNILPQGPVCLYTILSCEEIFCLKAQCVYIQSCLVKKYFASRPSVFIYNLVLWRNILPQGPVCLYTILSCEEIFCLKAQRVYI